MATYNEETWKAWMLASLAGDAACYRQLLSALKPWLTAYFRKRLPHGDFDDLTQMTLLALHEKRHTFDPSARFMPWLVAVARHKLIDWVRKHRRHIHVELDEELVASDEADTGLAARDVAALMAHLSPDQAEALRLHKLMDLSVDEVSAKTGKSASSIKVLVHRGLKKLQLLVGQNADKGAVHE